MSKLSVLGRKILGSLNLRLMSGHNDHIMQNRTWNLHEELIKKRPGDHGQRYGQHCSRHIHKKVKFYGRITKTLNAYLRRSFLRLIERWMSRRNKSGSMVQRDEKNTRMAATKNESAKFFLRGEPKKAKENRVCHLAPHSRVENQLVICVKESATRSCRRNLIPPLHLVP